MNAMLTAAFFACISLALVQADTWSQVQQCFTSGVNGCLKSCESKLGNRQAHVSACFIPKRNAAFQQFDGCIGLYKNAQCSGFNGGDDSSLFAHTCDSIHQTDKAGHLACDCFQQCINPISTSCRQSCQGGLGIITSGSGLVKSCYNTAHQSAATGYAQCVNA